LKKFLQIDQIFPSIGKVFIAFFAVVVWGNVPIPTLHPVLRYLGQRYRNILHCFSAIDAAFGQPEQWDQYTDAAYAKLGKKLLARKDIEEAQRLDSANS